MPESLYVLALLACPVGMGAMMWMMSRSRGGSGGGSVEHDVSRSADEKRLELAGLQAQIDQLRAAERDRAGADESRGPLR